MMNRLEAAEKRYANLKYLWEQEKLKNAALVVALEDVEWVWIQGATVQFCPWCDNSKMIGHARNCKRQQALALVEGEGL